MKVPQKRFKSVYLDFHNERQIATNETLKKVRRRFNIDPAFYKKVLTGKVSNLETEYNTMLKCTRMMLSYKRI